MFNKKLIYLFIFLFNAQLIAKPFTISYSILTHNETKCLDQLLNYLIKNIDKEDEIIIVDDFSDNTETLKILELYSSKSNVKVYRNSLNFDFSQQRNFANSLCTKDYIFVVDADQIPSLYLLQNIKSILKSNADGYYVPTIIMLYGLPDNDLRLNIREWLNWPCYQIRLYKNNNKIHWIRPIHNYINMQDIKSFEYLPAEEKYALIEQKTYVKTTNSFGFYLQCYKNWLVKSFQKRNFDDIKVALNEVKDILIHSKKQQLDFIQDKDLLKNLKESNAYNLLSNYLDKEVKNETELLNLIRYEYSNLNKNDINLQSLKNKYENNINGATDNYGNTLLAHASYNNEVDLVRELIFKKADTTLRNINGHTPYDHAKFMGHTQITQLLLKETLKQELSKHGLNLYDNVNQIINQKNQTLLTKIAEADNFYTTKLLLEFGADPLLKDSDNLIPLDYAKQKSNTRESLLTKTLNAELNKHNIAFTGVVTLPINEQNQTLLTFSILNNHYLLTKLLIEYGADCNIKDIYGKTPYDYALKKNNSEMLKILSATK